jgi:hypothetical protein
MPQLTFKELTPQEVYDKIRRVEAKLELCQVDEADEVQLEGIQATIEDATGELRQLWTDIDLDGQKAGAPAESEG